MKAFKTYFTPAPDPSVPAIRPETPEASSSAKGSPKKPGSKSILPTAKELGPTPPIPAMLAGPSGTRAPRATPVSATKVPYRAETPSSLVTLSLPGSPSTPRNTILDPSASNSSLSPQDAASYPHQPQNSPKQSASASRPNSFSGSGPMRKSRGSSLRYSIFPAGDARNSSGEALMEIRNDMMVNWLYEQQLRKQYASGYHPFEGVVLKKERGSFTCCPQQMACLPGSLFSVISQMNVRCAMTVNTPAVRALLGSINRESPTMGYVPLSDGLQMQILPSMSDLPKSQLHHFAAFIEDVRMLVVWDDEPEKLLQRAQTLEMTFMTMIWGNGNDPTSGADTPANEKKDSAVYVTEEALDPDQLEQALQREHRPIRLMSSLMVACTLALCITCLGLGWRSLSLEIAVDGNYVRLALIAVSPLYFFVSLFFFQALVGNVFQIFGPISAVSSNSRFYSGKPPKRLNRHLRALPHVTIQMPVYKEGLAAVIKPTVVSLKAAISTYEMQGGTANIFINDDGMQLIGDDMAQARRDFYDEHNIGWVARPPHCANPNSEKGERQFLRRGKFKKASNMNYALHISNRVEEKLVGVMRGPHWTADHELSAYYRGLEEVLQEDEGRTWAEGNIRVGDYILLIDSDTRVPRDCLLDAVSELEQDPEVALIQFSSGVMNVTNSFFENGVTWFTRLIYTAITFAVAAGDACPFVGHNAILRWSAIQTAAAYEDEDGYEKYWSESHVSEDFDMALRLQVKGYTLRYAAYTGDGFKEGVSLTVYDELARWEKYAYGCNELLFHPLRYWLTRGPFTPLFRRFMTSCIPLPKKLTILAYIGTYYAIAAAWCLSIANYFLTGWYYGLYDKYYMDSFAIYVAIVIVFTGLGNISLAVLRYRMTEQSLLGSLFENFKWIPMFTIFLGGISIHVAQAILSHFFEIDMHWGATAKEIEDVHFGQEMMRILRHFKYTFLFCFACTALMVCGWYAFPFQWRITTLFSIYPLATVVVSHFALPVLLNPALMMFTW